MGVWEESGASDKRVNYAGSGSRGAGGHTVEEKKIKTLESLKHWDCVEASCVWLQKSTLFLRKDEPSEGV